MCRKSSSPPPAARSKNVLYDHSTDAIALITMSALLVQFTDLSGGTLHTESESWMVVLWLTGINPATVARLWQVMVRPSSMTCSHSLSKRQMWFICHEVIHTITGFYHYFPFEGLVWLAIVNFPLWFAHLDLCMKEKELLDQKLSSYKNTSSSGSYAYRFNGASIVQRNPLVTFSLIIYTIGVLLRGQSFLLSGVGVVIMSLPFLRRRADFSVAATVPPLVILFALEHYTIMNEMDTWHNVVHSLSHITLHVTVNNLYKHHVP